MADEKRYWEKWDTPGIIAELEATWATDMWIVDVIRRTIPTNDDGTVLDVGCGTGRASTLFNAEKYLGVDTEPEMIKRAKELYPTKRFELGDAYHLRYKDSEFDLVLCNAVLHHIPEIEPALAELWRVTGRYLLTSFLCGSKNECKPMWHGFLSHMVTFDSMMGLLRSLNPKPHRITAEYIDLYAHGTIILLEKRGRPDLKPVDDLGVQW
jgi:ubiquinone/menaquinone biosynthesis C-methylase UbiE